MCWKLIWFIIFLDTLVAIEVILVIIVIFPTNVIPAVNPLIFVSWMMKVTALMGSGALMN